MITPVRSQYPQQSAHPGLILITNQFEDAPRRDEVNRTADEASRDQARGGNGTYLRIDTRLVLMIMTYVSEDMCMKRSMGLAWSMSHSLLGVKNCPLIASTWVLGFFRR